MSRPRSLLRREAKSPRRRRDPSRNPNLPPPREQASVDARPARSRKSRRAGSPNSKRDIPHFYVQAEADVTGLLDFRDKMNRDPTATRLTLTHFVVAAVARALAEAPESNSVWRDGEIILFDEIDIGLAVDTERGLVAPVLRGVDRLGLDALASTAMRLVRTARDGRLVLGDMEGGAITVSNVGMFGVSQLAAIINPGQSAILGVGAVRPTFRPDETGAPKLCQELGLVLSADHRVWDGVRAARFLDSIVRRLEHPLRLLR